MKTNKSNLVKIEQALLESDTCRSSAIKTIEIGYSDCHEHLKGIEHDIRLLEFKVEIDASALVMACNKYISNGYNCFTPVKILAILEALVVDRDGEIPQNFKTSLTRNYKFYFGRESSPVLYIHTKGSRWWIKNLNALAEASGADEVSIESDGSLRLWWD